MAQYSRAGTSLELRENDVQTSLYIQYEEIKRDPEMDKSAVWAGSGCMAVFPISGSSLIPPPGIVKAILLTRDCLYT